MDLFNYQPRHSHEVRIGNKPLGGLQPLRLQSMTTTLTTDTEASVAQCIDIIKAGADYIRLTTQGLREAENLKNIREALHRQGFDTPLVADVHFNPRVADAAAEIVEKVRINPGIMWIRLARSRNWSTPTRSMPPNWRAWKIALCNSSTFAAPTAQQCASV